MILRNFIAGTNESIRTRWANSVFSSNRSKKITLGPLFRSENDENRACVTKKNICIRHTSSASKVVIGPLVNRLHLLKHKPIFIVIFKYKFVLQRMILKKQYFDIGIILLR